MKNIVLFTLTSFLMLSQLNAVDQVPTEQALRNAFTQVHAAYNRLAPEYQAAFAQTLQYQVAQQPKTGNRIDNNLVCQLAQQLVDYYVVANDRYKDAKYNRDSIYYTYNSALQNITAKIRPIYYVLPLEKKQAMHQEIMQLLQSAFQNYCVASKQHINREIAKLCKKYSKFAPYNTARFDQSALAAMQREYLAQDLQGRVMYLPTNKQNDIWTESQEIDYTSGYHALFNAFAIEDTLKKRAQLDPINLQKKAAELFNIMNNKMLTIPDMINLADKLKLQNVYFLTLNENDQLVFAGTSSRAIAFNDITPEKTGIEHFIFCIEGGRWVLMTRIKQPQKPALYLYLDPKQAIVIENSDAYLALTQMLAAPQLTATPKSITPYVIGGISTAAALAGAYYAYKNPTAITQKMTSVYNWVKDLGSNALNKIMKPKATTAVATVPASDEGRMIYETLSADTSNLGWGSVLPKLITPATPKQTVSIAELISKASA